MVLAVVERIEKEERQRIESDRQKKERTMKEMCTLQEERQKQKELQKQKVVGAVRPRETVGRLQENEAEEKIRQYWISVSEREALSNEMKRTAAEEADRRHRLLCKDIAEKARAVQEEEEIRQILCAEEQRERDALEQRRRREREEKQIRDVVAENEKQIQLKVRLSVFMWRGSCRYEV